MPKTDAVIKLELGMRDQQQPIPRFTSADNKENMFDGNPLCAHAQSATASVAPCRPKNDVSCFSSILLMPLGHATCFVDAILLIGSLTSSTVLRLSILRKFCMSNESDYSPSEIKLNVKEKQICFFHSRPSSVQREKREENSSPAGWLAEQ